MTTKFELLFKAIFIYVVNGAKKFQCLYGFEKNMNARCFFYFFFFFGIFLDVYFGVFFSSSLLLNGECEGERERREAPVIPCQNGLHRDLNH